MMHQLKCNAQKNLNDQVHHDVHDANVHEHVSYETPCFVPPERIINEQCGSRPVRVLADVLVVVRILTKKNEQIQFIPCFK